MMYKAIKVLEALLIQRDAKIDGIYPLGCCHIDGIRTHST
jgi:hypothetical protein